MFVCCSACTHLYLRSRAMPTPAAVRNSQPDQVLQSAALNACCPETAWTWCLTSVRREIREEAAADAFSAQPLPVKCFLICLQPPPALHPPQPPAMTGPSSQPQPPCAAPQPLPSACQPSRLQWPPFSPAAAPALGRYWSTRPGLRSSCQTARRGLRTCRFRLRQQGRPCLCRRCPAPQHSPQLQVLHRQASLLCSVCMSCHLLHVAGYGFEHMVWTCPGRLQVHSFKRSQLLSKPCFPHNLGLNGGCRLHQAGRHRPCVVCSCAGRKLLSGSTVDGRWGTAEATEDSLLAALFRPRRRVVRFGRRMLQVRELVALHQCLNIRQHHVQKHCAWGTASVMLSRACQRSALLALALPQDVTPPALQQAPTSERCPVPVCCPGGNRVNN